MLRNTDPNYFNYLFFFHFHVLDGIIVEFHHYAKEAIGNDVVLYSGVGSIGGVILLLIMGIIILLKQRNKQIGSASDHQ
jgi:hypothetical protein